MGSSVRDPSLTSAHVSPKGAVFLESQVSVNYFSRLPSCEREGRRETFGDLFLGGGFFGTAPLPLRCPKGSDWLGDVLGTEPRPLL